MVLLNNLPNLLPRVVVVNDDTTQLSMLCGLLHKAGYESTAFKSAETALAAMGQDLAPDLIVTDVYMPGIDGWRFCRLLRSREYERFNLTPILVVSATFSGEEPSQITSDLGANAFLPMPVDGQQFIEQVQALLRGEKQQSVLKVLIVEDSKLISGRLLQAFRKHGYQADAALTYQEGLSRIGQTAYDIAVLDYHLPDGLGDGLVQALQLSGQTAKPSECVCMMITADPNPELALTWMKMGAAAYLQKPFEPEYLIALCERARREHALLRSQDLLEERTQQLQESEQKYRNFIQYSSDPIFAFNPDESYRFVNEAFARPFGMKPEEIIGKTPHAIFSPVEAERRMALIRRVFITGEKGEIEVKVVTRTGEERYYLTMADPVKDEQCQVLYVTCISKDITERKQAEAIQKEALDRLLKIASRVPGVVYQYRLRPDGSSCFPFASEAIKDIFRVTPEDVREDDSKIFLFLHPDDKSGVIASIQASAQDLSPWQHEYRVKFEDGTIRFLYGNAVPQREQDGSTLWHGFITDITELKQVDKLLEDTRKNYEIFFNSIDDLLFVLDEQGTIIHINNTVTSRLGYSEKELIGQSVLVVHTPERREEAARIVGEMLAGLTEFCPVPLRTKSGELIAVETRVTPGFWNDKPALFGVTKDISQIKLSEEKFSKAFQSNSALMALTRVEDGTYLDVNDAFLKTLGFTREEVIGKKSTELRLLADPDQRNRVLEILKQNGMAKDIEVVVRTKNGSLRYGVFSADIIYVGKDTCLLTVMMDITERKQAEAALREEEYTLKQMASFTEELLKTGEDQVTYQKILENLLYLSKAKYGALTILKENTGKFTTVAVAGLQDRLKNIAKILGAELIGKEWNNYSTENEKLKGKVIARFSSIGKLVGMVIPDIISSALEKLLNIGEVTVTKVIVNNQVIGDFTLMMPAGKHFENDYLVEIYSRQIDMFMTRNRSDAKLRQSEEKHRFLIENSHDIIYMLDAAGVFTFVSPSWTTLLGHPVDEVVGNPFQRFVHPDDLSMCLGWLKKVLESEQRQGSIEYRIQHADGVWYWHASSAVPIHNADGKIAGVEGTARDITQRKQAEAELRRAQDELESAHRELQKSFAREQALARIDDLTGINNHRSLLQLAEHEFNVAMRYHAPLSMLFFDIDHFKQINDTFGHLMGDLALKKMIKVICAEIRSVDAIGRYGGDEFVILLPRTTAEEARPFADRIHTGIAAMQLNTDKGSLTLSLSIGIAQTIHHTEQPDSVESLLLRADQALYAAKQAGRNCTVIFDADKTGAI